MQDRTGFLWVGTENGLFRYDGRQFRAYTKAQGLPSAQIEALHQTADGEIWVGTPQGLARLKGILSRRSAPVRATSRSPSRRMRAATSTWAPISGLLVAPPGGPQGKREFRLYTVAGESRTQQPVYGIGVESAGRVWYGCGLGICLLEGGRVRPLAASERAAGKLAGLSD